MCGIAGIIARPHQRVTLAQILPMQQAMKHRGPDGKGVFLDDRVGMTMRRLSIIDVDGGDQPLYNEDQSIVIVGNGEIYNYKELQTELKRRKHRLATKSDIETAVHLYEDMGLDFVDKLRGMFALAIYDKTKRRIVLARDRLGEKPLYWTKTNEGFAFASEMKVLLKVQSVDKELNWESIDRYFHYYYVPEPETMLSQVHKLPPGHLQVIDLETMAVTLKKYWTPETIEPAWNGNPTEAIRETFAQSCHLTLRSDVPVGIALSGGVDSGSILSLTAPVFKDTMKAFSVGYEGAPFSDERKLARKLAKRHGVEFIEKEIKTKEVVDNFPQLVYDGDDPIADIAGHSIYSVSQLARENNVPVLLGGLGGDELFWGYTWTRKAIKGSIERFVAGRGGWRETLARLSSSDYTERMMFYDLDKGFQIAESFITRIYTNEFAGKINRQNNYQPMEFAWNGDKLTLAKRGLDLIRDYWLVGNCVDLNDRLSMANSIELRSPFLDYELVELILNSRQAVMAYNKPAKYWLKQAMRGVLPTEIMTRPKRGFMPPVGEWVVGILNQYIWLLDGGFLVRKNVINEKKVTFLLKTWLTMPMYWHALYQLVLLEIWGREYYYGQEAQELSRWSSI